MIDYSKGKIYILKEKDQTIFYAGSTCNTLARRKAGHVSDAKSNNKVRTDLFDHIKSLGYIFDIELYEDFPCERKEQLLKREGEVQRDLIAKGITLKNKCIAGRSHSEYFEENKEKIYAKHKQYRDENKEKIREQRLKYLSDPVNLEKTKETRRKYEKNNREVIAAKKKEYKKKYMAENREKVNEKKKEKIVCDVCSGQFSRSHRARHMQSEKHKLAQVVSSKNENELTVHSTKNENEMRMK